MQGQRRERVAVVLVCMMCCTAQLEGLCSLAVAAAEAKLYHNCCLDGTINSVLYACCAQGGFSEVQLAQDKLTGKEVALKVIFLNRPGLTTEQVTWQACTEGSAHSATSSMHHFGICSCKQVAGLSSSAQSEAAIC
jgi:hypothetical protein